MNYAKKLMLVPYDENNIYLLEQKASEALQTKNIQRYNHLLQKIKQIKATKVQQTRGANITDDSPKKVVTIEPSKNKSTTEKGTQSDMLNVQDEQDEQMEISRIHIEEEPDKTLELRKQIAELTEKAKRYKNLVIEFNNELQKIKGSQNQNQTSNKKRKLPEADPVDKRSDKQKKYESLLQEHLKAPKSRYSYSTEVTNGKERDLDSDTESSRIVLDSKTQNKRINKNTGTAWTTY